MFLSFWKISKFALPLAFVGLLYSGAFGWGFWAHQEINRQAIKCLPSPLYDFFAANETFIVQASTQADQRRFKDSAEAFYHYLDLDRYGKAPFPELPHDYSEAVRRFGADSVQKNGLLPWRIVEVTEKLSDAMRRGEKQEVLAYAADLGHYVADAHVPLHATENYDGQLTEQSGIHSRFESRLPELYGKLYRLSVDSAAYISDPLGRAFDILLESYTLVDSVLKSDLRAKSGLTNRDIHIVTRKNGKTEYRYSDEYYRRFHEALNGLVEKRIRASIRAVASFWYSAWVNAGKPELRV